jgi:penicillin V acylase-like amidase (Ntn superfamily)
MTPRTAWVTALTTTMTLVALPSALACTRILWNSNTLAVLSSRTMDWPESTEPVLTVLPRGLQRNGGKLGAATIVADNPARWRSKYGSVVVTVYGIGAADGLNERGLAGHLLYLTASDYGARNPAKPGLNAGLWLQYVLDNAANVAEALQLLEAVQIVGAEARGHKATVHLALEDASGDSAVIEHIKGTPVVHHSREYRVMTNDPPYQEQLALLKGMDFSKPSSEMPLPGNVNPRDRFQRASYYLGMLPAPKTEREAVAGVLAIARNVSVPFGAPYKGFGVYNTEYRTAIDLTNGRYFFELTTAPNVVWVELTRFDFSPGAPVMLFDPNRIELSGDVSRHFTRSAQAPF